jgi:ribose transport system permease protein
MSQSNNPASSILSNARAKFFGYDSSSVLLATITLVLLMGALHPAFLQANQLRDIFQQTVYSAFLGMGMCFLIAMRDVDLSVGSTMGLSMCMSALLIKSGTNPWVAAAAALAVGALIGVMNSSVIRWVGIQALMATLAIASLIRGVVVGITNGQQIASFPVNSSFFSFLSGFTFAIPNSDIILVVVLILLTILLRRTAFGQRVLSIGSNPEAAEYSGISVNRVRLQAFMLVGVLAAMAGLFALAYFNSGDPTTGTGYELNAVAAAIIGGTSLNGGKASPVGAVIAAILLTAVSSGLVYFNVPVNWSQAVTGGVTLLALAVDSVLKKHRGKRTIS